MGGSLFVLISALVLLALMGVCRGRYGFIKFTNSRPEIGISDYYADIPDVHIARATYSNEINQTGWAFLEIYTQGDNSDELQAYAAGYLEGYLSRDLIWYHWQNMLKGYCYKKMDICGLIEEYVDDNEKWMHQQIDKMKDDDVYWYQVKLYYTQLEGMAIGFNEATEDEGEKLTIRDIIWINMLGDLDELAFSLSMPVAHAGDNMFPDHCSGLVKLLSDWSDLYVSQVTWNSYQSMLRMQKTYVLNYKRCPKCKDKIPGYKMALSSYPAFLQSTDDFYIISSGLVAAETTIGNSNRTLFELVKPTDSILEYARAMLANRLAVDGKSWTEIFKRYNSGTYNNQWYIVDYNKFKPKSKYCVGEIQDGLLWVIEQLPGNTEAADLTKLLMSESYFASYNIPFFPRIFNLSGGWARVEMYGDWFGYQTNPRAKIFKEKQVNIHNLYDMYQTMRYNDFKHDPLAHCAKCRPPYSATNAISARCDLNPANGTYPFRALGHRSHGGTDTKITSAFLRRSYEFISICSPTYNISRGIPPFEWSKFDLGTTVSHIGQPEVWMFPPLVHRWEWQ